MIDKKYLDNFKNCPEGSNEKKIYDSFTMPFSDWVEKYYKNPELKTWKGFSKWANEAFDKSEEFQSVWCKGRVIPYNYDELHKAYNRLKGLGLFEEDINKYIAFIAGDGFFEMYNIGLDEWLHSSNWQNPFKDCKDYGTCLSLIELIKMKHGENYIRDFLAGIDYWKVR